MALIQLSCQFVVAYNKSTTSCATSCFCTKSSWLHNLS